jgi:hypothetical protein
MVERLSRGTIVVGICVRQRYMNITFTFIIMAMTDGGRVGLPFSRSETNKAFGPSLSLRTHHWHRRFDR